MKTKTRLQRLADEYREACVNLADEYREACVKADYTGGQRGYERWLKARSALLAWAESERQR